MIYMVVLVVVLRNLKLLMGIIVIFVLERFFE